MRNAFITIQTLTRYNFWRRWKEIAHWSNKKIWEPLWRHPHSLRSHYSLLLFLIYYNIYILHVNWMQNHISAISRSNNNAHFGRSIDVLVFRINPATSHRKLCPQLEYYTIKTWQTKRLLAMSCHHCLWLEIR